MTDQLAEITSPPRDRYGRYLLPRPDDQGGKPISYTRATTVAKAPEDQGGLMKWAQRMVVVGLGRRKDLHAMAATTDPSDKLALGQIAKDAEEAGGAATGRNTGTAIHAAIEVVNRGEEPLPLFEAEVTAYRGALADAGLTPVPELVERVVADTEHLIAGTFDVGLRDEAGNLFVADLKTGSVGYPAAFAVQLAIYATADSIVPRDSWDRFEAAPEFNQERGVIIHLPEGGPCTLHWIDLEAGRRGLRVALDVRAWRSKAKAKNLLTEIAATDGTNNTTAVVGVEGTVDNPTTSHPSPEPATGTRPGDGGSGVEVERPPAPSAPDPERLAWFSARYDEVREAAGPKAIKVAWPEDLATPKHRDQWSPGELDRAIKVLSRVAAKADMPFGSPDPQPAKLRRKPSRGPKDASAEEAREAKQAYQRLPDDRQSLVLAWQSEANTAVRSFTAKADKPSRWSVLVSQAACGLAAHTDDDDIARAWLTLVMGEDTVQTHPVGALLGSLTLTEAERLCELVDLDTFAAAIDAVDTAA